jgi:hypothetical protein
MAQWKFHALADCNRCATDQPPRDGRRRRGISVAKCASGGNSLTALELFGWAVTVPILAGGVFLTRSPAVDSQSSLVRGGAAADIVLMAEPREMDDDPGDREEPGANGFVDVYGNEVTDAIATYTFDRAGSLYELHSPQTELPRLGMPKS